MLAYYPLLMPDQPGKGSPSSAPLSLEDADRLAEGFTPFWEDAADPAPAAAEPVAAATLAPTPAAVVPAPMAALTPAPAAAPAPVTKLNLKQTLYGIAPINLGLTEPASVPPAAIPAAAQPIAPSAPVTVTQRIPLQPSVGPVAVSGEADAAPRTDASAQPSVAADVPLTAAIAAPQAMAAAGATQPPSHAAPIRGGQGFLHKQTLFGFSPAPEPTAPEMPGYAIAHTPKDGPSTPAVVIAPLPEADPAPARKSGTPSGLSSARAASSAAAVPVPPSAHDNLDIYLRKKGTGKFVFVALGAALALLAIAGIRALTGSSTTASSTTAAPGTAPPSSPSAPNVAAAPATPLAAAPELESSPTAPPPRSTPAAVPAPELVQSAAGSASGTAHKSRATALRAAPAAPRPAAPAAKSVPASAPATREPAAAAFPPEPSVPPKATPSKGVIVRDTPF